MATYFCSTASEIFPYVVAVQVAMTLRTRSNGSDLSAITVTSRVDLSWRRRCPGASDGRARDAAARPAARSTR